MPTMISFLLFASTFATDFGVLRVRPNSTWTTVCNERFNQQEDDLVWDSIGIVNLFLFLFFGFIE